MSDNESDNFLYYLGGGIALFVGLTVGLTYFSMQMREITVPWAMDIDRTAVEHSRQYAESNTRCYRENRKAALGIESDLRNPYLAADHIAAFREHRAFLQNEACRCGSAVPESSRSPGMTKYLSTCNL
ncbi:MAG: hypothetical protein P1V36_00430 [Planctomycetota bacterium]|nr:hypothetical protein [Planctomycetota bacterium]